MENKQNQEKSIDQSTRHEASLAFADGNDRQAINLLIQRINQTNGYCSAKNWLMLLDIYQTLEQRTAYEKLAVFFSNRFNFSPPAWIEIENKGRDGGGKQEHWRNALVIEGSPMGILDEKTRDFIRASKDEGSARIDFSRMRLSEEDEQLKKELEKLLSIMRRLRKIKKPTLLMGDSEVASILQDKIKNNDGGGTYEGERVYWEMLFELVQWRGKEDEFNDLSDRFSDRFEYCPIGYEPDQAIAITPSQEYSLDGDFTLEGVVDNAEKTMLYLQKTWETQKHVEVSLLRIKRMSSQCARDLAEFLRASLESGFAQEQVGGDMINMDSNEITFTDTPETIVALFEITGVSAYSTIHYQHSKLRDLISRDEKKEK